MKILVILNPHFGEGGGKAEEYYDPDYYAQMMDNIHRDAFLETIKEIQSGKSSKNYTSHSDGAFSIHIHKPGGPYAINIVCKAKWK